MRIGLVDIDLLIQPNSKILNVELMKLGAYYEELGHQVEVLHPKSYIYDYDKLCIFCNFRIIASAVRRKLHWTYDFRRFHRFIRILGNLCNYLVWWYYGYPRYDYRCTFICYYLCRN